MLPEGARVIAAVSGGADSVCLLHVLRELAPKAVVGVGHFNHKWRREASDEDERYVRELAGRMELPFFRAEADPEAPHDNLEQKARRERQEFFAGLPATVALGHTRDDQAETVLFRFLRGSGLAGLAGIAPAAAGMIRPLIDVTRSEVEEYLRDRGIVWREDASNNDLRFARNRIRQQLLPQLTREWNPNLTETLARLADLAQEEENYWETELSGSSELSVGALAALPRAVARRLVRRAILQAKGNLRGIDFDHVEAVMDLKRTLHLPGLTVTRSFDWLRFSRAAADAPPGAVEILPPGAFPAPDGLSKICVDVAHGDGGTAPNPCATLKVEACWLESYRPLVLRGWQPGDHYRPEGQSRDRKIQEMFQRARVPSWKRASWPILTSEDKILWSRQFGVAHEFATPGGRPTQLRIREDI